MNLFTASLKYVGLKEVLGPKSDPILNEWIERYFQKGIDDGEVSTCSIGIKALTDEFGYDNEGSTVAAIDWRNCGEKIIELDSLLSGDVVVLHRFTYKHNWKRHVGIFGGLNYEGDLIVSSLNDGDTWTIRPYEQERFDFGVRLNKILNPV